MVTVVRQQRRVDHLTGVRLVLRLVANARLPDAARSSCPLAAGVESHRWKVVSLFAEGLSFPVNGAGEIYMPVVIEAL